VGLPAGRPAGQGHRPDPGVLQPPEDLRADPPPQIQEPPEGRPDPGAPGEKGQQDRLKGPLAELKGALYAPLEPRADILELLAPHFARRLPGERWALHDVGRRKALIHEGGRILPAEAPGEPLPAEEDEAFRRLWRTYFDAIRIEHRVNPRLQKRFIPERYWKYLPEKAPLPLEG